MYTLVSHTQMNKYHEAKSSVCRKQYCHNVIVELRSSWELDRPSSEYKREHQYRELSELQSVNAKSAGSFPVISMFPFEMLTKIHRIYYALFLTIHLFVLFSFFFFDTFAESGK